VAKPLTYAVIPRIGFYDGMFGPGNGVFFSPWPNVMLRRAKPDFAGQRPPQNPLISPPTFQSWIVFTLYRQSGLAGWGLVMMVGHFYRRLDRRHFLLQIDPNQLRPAGGGPCAW